MIHVCYALRDNSGLYWKNTAASILSIIDNSPENICFHILHDNTLVQENKNKLENLVFKSGNSISYYNLEKMVCWQSLEKLSNLFTDNIYSDFNIAMFYRLFIFSVLPEYIHRVIYLDSDTIVNLDIKELWIQECKNGIGAVLDLVIVSDIPESKPVICADSEKYLKKYFNSGVLILERKSMPQQVNNIEQMIKTFFSKYYNSSYPDQDYLNYYYTEIYTELLYRFNSMVTVFRFFGEYSLESRIYHYANKAYLKNVGDCYSRLYSKYYPKFM